MTDDKSQADGYYGDDDEMDDELDLSFLDEKEEESDEESEAGTAGTSK